MISRESSVRGFSLVELAVVLAISAIIVSMVASSIRDLVRTNASRQLVTDMQGEGRSGVTRVLDELREASLGSAYGVAIANTWAGVQGRPTVQLFDNVVGGADWLDVKPGTDVLLVIAASVRVFDGVRMAPVQASVTAPLFDPVATPVAITDVARFEVGQYVLAGPYKTAGWAQVQNVTGAPGAPGTLQLAAGANVLPEGKLDRGALVRAATARLYYVNRRDELVVHGLRVPHAPRAAVEADPGVEILARGIENMQLDCQLDGGGLGWFQGCPAPLGAGDIVAESLPAGLTGPRMDAQAIGNLRTVTLSVVARSREPIVDAHGDDPVAIGNGPALPPAGADPAGQYTRRAYRATVGVRNTSLGVL